MYNDIVSWPSADHSCELDVNSHYFARILVLEPCLYKKDCEGILISLKKTRIMSKLVKDALHVDDHYHIATANMINSHFPFKMY